MKLNSSQRTIVVGAGAGGIASALLARLRGDEVLLFEAHENIGGCASWFNRGPFSFDAGATTLSGIHPHEPMGKLFALLNQRPALHVADPGMVISLSSGATLEYFRDFDRWMVELKRVFPHLKHEPFWKKVHALNSQGWGLLAVMGNFPFKKLQDFSGFLKHPRYWPLAIYLLVSTEMMLKFYELDDPLYHEMINGILLISAQAESRELPFLVGAMGLAYPGDSYAPVGGMEGLMHFFEDQCRELGIEVKKNSPIKKIQELESLAPDSIVLNLPVWNICELLSAPSPKEERFAWGAFTVYLGCTCEEERPYHQVHLNHPWVKNYFVSFSVPGDELRAPEGWRAVTISTHTDPQMWFGLSKDDYKKLKKEFETLILEDFLRRFKITQTKFVSSGTPRTFEKYTLRKRGRVGGLPFLYGMNPWKLLDHHTKTKNIYRVGDTTFPGQGIVGVVAGALGLHQELSKSLSECQSDDLP